MNKLIKKNQLFISIIVLLSILISINSVLTIRIREYLINLLSKGSLSIPITIIAILGIIYIAFIKYLNVYATQGLFRSLRATMIKKIQTNTMDFSEEEKVVVNYDTLLNNDIEFILEKYIKQIINLIVYILTAIFCYTYGFIINPLIATFGLIMMLSSYFLNKYFGLIMSKFQQEYLFSLGKFMNKVGNFLKNYRTIKTYSIEKEIYDEFNKTNNAFLSTYKKKLVYLANTNTINAVFYAIQKIGIIIIGGYLFYNNNINIGQLVATIYLSSLLSSPIINISQCIMFINSTKEIRKSLDKYLNYNNKRMIDIEGFHNLELKIDEYVIQDKEILSDIYFNIEKGKKYLIVGKSGAGKTTILKLLTRQIIAPGVVYRINSRLLNNDEVYTCFDIVKQNSKVFSCSIENNISLFSKEINDLKAKEVLDLVGLNFDLDYIINNQDPNMSGGELQRISIARALYHNRHILFFDEALSSVEKELRHTIERNILTREGTFINVSHYINKDLLHLYNKIFLVDNKTIQEIDSEYFKEKVYERII